MVHVRYNIKGYYIKTRYYSKRQSRDPRIQDNCFVIYTFFLCEQGSEYKMFLGCNTPIDCSVEL